MANSKISALTSAATVAGTEVLPIVQSSATVKVAISDLNPGLSTILATKGGTGQTSYAVGDLLYASTTTALSKLADVATGNALISGGVGVAPSYGKIGLTTHVSGTLPVANGGTNLTSFTSGGVVYASSTSAVTTGSALNYNGTTLKVASTSSAIDIGLTGDTTYHYVRTIDNAGQSIYFGNDNAAGSFFGAGAYGRVIYSEGTAPVIFYNNAVERFRFDTSLFKTTIPGEFSTSLKISQIGSPSYLLYSNSANASARNWAIQANNQVFGDFSILQSNAINGDPLAAGTVREYFGKTGGISIGDTTDPGAGNLRMGTGNVVQGTAAKGFNFTANTPAAGMTSQLLNWYEEGTWTPVLRFGGGTTGITYTTQQGRYTRIGRTVTIRFEITLSSKGSSTGEADITGLPFSAANLNAMSVYLYSNFLLTYKVGIAYCNGSTINEIAANGTAAFTDVQFTNTSRFWATCTYQV